jgi:hypothetical protein
LTLTCALFFVARAALALSGADVVHASAVYRPAAGPPPAALARPGTRLVFKPAARVPTPPAAPTLPPGAAKGGPKGAPSLVGPAWSPGAAVVDGRAVAEDDEPTVPSVGFLELACDAPKWQPWRRRKDGTPCVPKPSRAEVRARPSFENEFARPRELLVEPTSRTRMLSRGKERAKERERERAGR